MIIVWDLCPSINLAGRLIVFEFPPRVSLFPFQLPIFTSEKGEENLDPGNAHLLNPFAVFFRERRKCLRKSGEQNYTGYAREPRLYSLPKAPKIFVCFLACTWTSIAVCAVGFFALMALVGQELIFI